jgi:hypothetical protein
MLDRWLAERLELRLPFTSFAALAPHPQFPFEISNLKSGNSSYVLAINDFAVPVRVGPLRSLRSLAAKSVRAFLELATFGIYQLSTFHNQLPQPLYQS